MPERVVKVSLRADINNYLSGMEQAARKTREVGTEAERTAAKLQQQRQAFQLLGAGLIAAGTLAAAAVAVAVKKWADFDEAMSAVNAATHETTANMERLRDAALDAGARTVFSATEAANAIEELGKAGLTTEDILSGGLDGALDLAAAGGIGVADAAGIAATALKVFKLEGSDMAHVADLLAAGAGKAMGDVTDLSAALSQSGQVAASTGLSIEETTAALSAFASQGLLGSDAGTSFKAMLQRLTPQSAEAKKKMDELGISAYDASGNFIGLSEFAGNLQDGLKGLTTEQRNSALATIFGSDAVRAATVLYSEGEDGIRDWEKAVNDQGYAADTAARRLDNLKGDIEQFGGAVDTAAIKAGELTDGPLRFLTQAATDMVQGFADAPAGIQQTTLAVVAVTAAVALSGGAFLVAVPKIAEYRAALATLGPTAQRTSRIVGGLFKGLAIAGGVAIGLELIGHWVKTLQLTDAELQNVALSAGSAEDALKATSQGLQFSSIKTDAQGVRDALEASARASENWLDFMNEGQIGTVSNLRKMGEGLASLAKTDLPSAQRGFRQLAEDLNLNETEQFRLLSVQDTYKAALVDQANQLGLTADKQTLLKLAMGETEPVAQDNTEALAGLQGAAADAEGSVSELADAIRGFGSAQLDTRDAAREFQDAIASLNESVAANGTSLDITTEAGRSNEAALDGIAQAALTSAAAIAEQTGSQELASAAVATGREELVKALAQFGITGAEAEAYADKLGLIPGNIATYLDLQKDDAQRAIDEFIRINSERKIHIAVGAGGAGGLTVADGGVVDYYARGGIRERHVAQIAPAGSWRVWAEPETGGEAYIPLAASKRARSLDVWADTGSRLGVPGFASGGMVPPVYAQQSFGGGPGAVAGMGQAPTFIYQATPIRDQDPQTSATITGREFARMTSGGAR